MGLHGQGNSVLEANGVTIVFKARSDVDAADSQQADDAPSFLFKITLVALVALVPTDWIHEYVSYSIDCCVVALRIDDCCVVALIIDDCCDDVVQNPC